MTYIEKPIEAQTADQNFYWFLCPICRTMGCVDDDQVRGLVSIQCQHPGCGFHDTGTVSPLIPCDQPMKSENCPTWENYRGLE